MARRRRTYKIAGISVGVLAVVAIVVYVYYNRQPAGPGHPRPRVGRGYGATPYGQPSGNPGPLRGLPGGDKGACGCHGGISC